MSSHPIKRSRHYSKKGFDLSELERLAEGFKELGEHEVGEMVQDSLGALGKRYLKEVRALTPDRDVDYDPPDSRLPKDYSTGYMRRKWELTSVNRQKNNSYIITVKNDARFAKAVEYGHRQEVGLYVNQIHNHLEKDWVEGLHITRRATEKLNANNEFEKVLKRNMKKLVKEAIDGK